MLHGGKDRRASRVDGRSPSLAPLALVQDHVSGRRSRARRRGGCCATRPAAGTTGRLSPVPVPDARWALDDVRRELGDVPVVLLGHSMGGRTAVAVADDPSVVGVVAWHPGCRAGEPVEPLAGKPLAAAHGRSDKITSFRQTRAFCRAAEDVASSVELVDRGRIGHYMSATSPAGTRSR